MTGADLATWTRTTFSADGHRHDVYRKGTGPGVVIIPEAPGPTPSVIGFAEDVVAHGYAVALTHLFGRIGAEPTGRELARSAVRLCVSREFTKLALGETTPLAGWLRALCRQLHEQTGGPGVGVVGMCFTGGFALAAMVDPSVAAPVVAQPSTPFPLGRARKADLNVSGEDLEVIRQRATAGCPVLGIRYESDPVTGTRFETLRAVLGDAFIAVELPGRGHSTLTEHRDETAIARLVAFFEERLRSSKESPVAGG